MSKRVLFVDKDGILRETKSMIKAQLEALLKSETLPQRLQSTRILNLMPFDIALTTYRSSRGWSINHGLLFQVLR